MNDLMLLYPNHRVEYGTLWIIHAFFREHLSPANTAESFEQSVAGCYPEPVKIGWIEYDLTRAFRELDQVSWNLALSEFIDNEIAVITCVMLIFCPLLLGTELKLDILLNCELEREVILWHHLYKKFL